MKKVSQDQKEGQKNQKNFRNQKLLSSNLNGNPSQETISKTLMNEESIINSNISQIVAKDDDNLNLTDNQNLTIASNLKLIVDSEENKGTFNLNEFFMKYNLFPTELSLTEIENLPNDKPLGLDMLKHFNKPEASDIVLYVQNQPVYCSKVINHLIKIVLMARSKYFENMFSENLKENSDNKVNISDYTFEELILILLFIYCDSLNLELNLALELLKVISYTKFLGS
jgi:hypothetical protein